MQVSTLNNFLLTELWVLRDRDTLRHVVWRYLTFNLLQHGHAVSASSRAVRADRSRRRVLPDLELRGDRPDLRIRYRSCRQLDLGRPRPSRPTPDRGLVQYDVHGVVRPISTVNLPELAAFNVDQVDPDIVVRRRFIGGRPRLRVANWRDADG